MSMYLLQNLESTISDFQLYIYLLIYVFSVFLHYLFTENYELFSLYNHAGDEEDDDEYYYYCYY